MSKRRARERRRAPRGRADRRPRNFCGTRGWRPAREKDRPAPGRAVAAFALELAALPIIVNLDVMQARRKMRSRDLAARIGIAEQTVSLLKSGKAKGVRFITLETICAEPGRQPGDLLAFRPETPAECGTARRLVSMTKGRFVL
jgi:putative transcriptional regulator